MKKNILVKVDKLDGYIYVCPYCHEYLCSRGPCPHCGGQASWREYEVYSGRVYYREGAKLFGRKKGVDPGGAGPGRS